MPRSRRFTRLAANLRHLRTKAEYSQQLVGEMIGVSRFAVSKYESGDRSPGTAGLRKLAHLYNTTIDALLNDDMTGRFTKEGPSDEA